MRLLPLLCLLAACMLATTEVSQAEKNKELPDDSENRSQGRNQV